MTTCLRSYAIVLLTVPLVASIPQRASAADERSINSPLSAEERAWVEPIVRFIDSVPIDPFSPTAIMQGHRINVFRKNGEGASELAFAHNAAVDTIVANPDNVVPTSLLHYPRKRKQEGAPNQKMWRGLATLLKELLAIDPTANVVVDDLHKDAEGLAADHYTSLAEGKLTGNTVRIHQAIHRPFTSETVRVSVDATTFVLRGGTRVLTEGAGLVHVWQKQRIAPAPTFAESVVGVRLHDTSTGEQLWINPNGVFKSQGKAFPGTRSLNWQQVESYHGVEAQKLDGLIAMHKSQFIDKAKSRFDDAEEASRIEREKRFSDGRGPTPNEPLLNHMYETLSKMPYGVQAMLDVFGFHLHDGRTGPVMSYKGIVVLPSDVGFRYEDGIQYIASPRRPMRATSNPLPSIVLIANLA